MSNDVRGNELADFVKGEHAERKLHALLPAPFWRHPLEGVEEYVAASSQALDGFVPWRERRRLEHRRRPDLENRLILMPGAG